jgi:hypothetical protein
MWKPVVKTIEAMLPFNESMKCHKIYVGVIVPNDPTLGEGGEPNVFVVDQVCAVAADAIREYMHSRPVACNCPPTMPTDCTCPCHTQNR